MRIDNDESDDDSNGMVAQMHRKIFLRPKEKNEMTKDTLTTPGKKDIKAEKPPRNNKSCLCLLNRINRKRKRYLKKKKKKLMKIRKKGP